LYAPSKVVRLAHSERGRYVYCAGMGSLNVASLDVDRQRALVPCEICVQGHVASGMSFEKLSSLTETAVFEPSSLAGKGLCCSSLAQECLIMIDLLGIHALQGSFGLKAESQMSTRTS
jgi:hypothetical protein